METPKQTVFQQKTILIALCTTSFVVSIDTFIMTNALPTIAKDFGISNAGYAWIGSAYMLSFGAALPMWANFSNICGRRAVLITTATIFLIGTIVAGLSRSNAALIAGRAVQGIGAGGLSVLANIVVGDVFTVRERSVYFGIVGCVAGVASSAGPTVGGILSQVASWRWVFWINLPFIGIALFVLVLFLRLKTDHAPVISGLQEIDWAGILSIIGATLMFLIGLQMGGTIAPWNSIRVILLILFGIIAYTMFVVIEWKVAKRPLMPLKLFTRVSYLAIFGVNISQSFITTGCTYFLPLYFQIVLGASPIMSGVYFLPTTLVLALSFVFVGHIVKRSGEYKLLVQVGACALVVSTGLFIHLGSHLDWPAMIIGQILVACGLGLTYRAPLIALHAQLEEEDVANGTATFQLLKTLSQTISVILGQVIFQAKVQKQISSLGGLDLAPGFLLALSSGNTISVSSSIASMGIEQQGAVRGVLAAAFSEMWIFYLLIAFGGFVSSFYIAKAKF
ncbi:MFS general substrate transporter [Mollisia scopiformis]|uniref:MFS general substrate transporter n=1 Tax=Mollisia scopiformis TaxID=149040 RepID=A0A194X337_MOLSC|nr:MFS general substrate transporter [Mollisia scopiformis]KUJ14242.1 MFS general substrate transporter [Mollisia scopiformis]